MGVNRAGLYYLPIPPDEGRIAQKKELMRRIDYRHVKFPYLGSRKITVKLREDGYKVGQTGQALDAADVYLCYLSQS